jgi:anti-sigma factor RsiW
MRSTRRLSVLVESLRPTGSDRQRRRTRGTAGPGSPSVILANVLVDVHGGGLWIGAGATILPGVSISRDGVIAAGAIVADDVPAASLVAGPERAMLRRWEDHGIAGSVSPPAR